MTSDGVRGRAGRSSRPEFDCFFNRAEAELDWAGFFTFSKEAGTYAAGLDGDIPTELALERLRECAELQDAITAARRQELVGQTISVLVDERGAGRSYREAPEIDGIVQVPDSMPVGQFGDVLVIAAEGTDLIAEPVGGLSASPTRAEGAVPVTMVAS